MVEHLFPNSRASVKMVVQVVVEVQDRLQEIQQLLMVEQETLQVQHQVKEIMEVDTTATGPQLMDSGGGGGAGQM
jgi:hypothetical protein